MSTLSRTLQFIISLTLTAIGIALAAFGGLMAINRMSGVGTDTRLDMTGIVVFAVGAVFFAVGAMWLLVVMVRPFFEKRSIDQYAEEVAEEERVRGLRR